LSRLPTLILRILSLLPLRVLQRVAAAAFFALGVLALVFGIWTVIADTQAPLVALTVDIVLLWFVSTLHHVTRSQRGHEPALGAHEAPSA